MPDCSAQLIGNQRLEVGFAAQLADAGTRSVTRAALRTQNPSSVGGAREQRQEKQALHGDEVIFSRG